MAKIMKRAQTGKNVPKGMVESEMSPGKMIPKSKSNYTTGNYAKMLGSKPKPKVAPKKPMKAGGMLKRADGSYSKRGLWDNLRSKAAKNKTTGTKPKAPSKAMLSQEKKIKAKGK